MFEQIIARIKPEIPEKKDLIPMVVAIIVGKLPSYVIQGGTALSVYEALSHHPEFIPLGITAYALIEAVSIYLGTKASIKRGYNSGIKSTGFFKAMNVLSPQSRRFNAFVGEVLNQVTNVVGLNPLGILANASAVIISDPTVILAQRLSSAVINAPFNWGADMALIALWRSKSH